MPLPTLGAGFSQPNGQKKGPNHPCREGGRRETPQLIREGPTFGPGKKHYHIFHGEEGKRGGGKELIQGGEERKGNRILCHRRGKGCNEACKGEEERTRTGKRSHCLRREFGPVEAWVLKCSRGKNEAGGGKKLAAFFKEEEAFATSNRGGKE